MRPVFIAAGHAQGAIYARRGTRAEPDGVRREALSSRLRRHSVTVVGGTLRTRSLGPMVATTRESLMPARAVRASWGLALILLSSSGALAARAAVQEVPCEPGPDLMLARDGILVACRLTATTDLLVGPARQRQGRLLRRRPRQVPPQRLSFLLRRGRGGAASYFTRGRSSTQCQSKARVAFDANGYLEYCS